MKYRVGKCQSLMFDSYYVVQRKVWDGWETIATYWDAKDATSHGKILKSKGHEVEFYI